MFGAQQFPVCDGLRPKSLLMPTTQRCSTLHHTSMWVHESARAGSKASTDGEEGTAEAQRGGGRGRAGSGAP